MQGRYSTVAVALHWASAIMLIGLAPLGWWMAAAIADPQRQQAAYGAFQMHKAMGMSLLGLTLVRIAWRLTHRPPALPETLSTWERFAAQAAHAAFYILLLALPLTGWLYVSAGWSRLSNAPLHIATTWFGLFEIPNIPGLSSGDDDLRRTIGLSSIGVHNLLSWCTMLVLALHIAGALKHHFIDRDHVLASMWSARAADRTSRGHWPRSSRPAAIVGAAAVVLVMIGAVAASRPDPGHPAYASGDAPANALQSGGDPAPGRAREWRVDSAGSELRFAGSSAGAAFNGAFGEWNARIWFDPHDLAGSKVVATVWTGSAKTGDPTQTATLAEREWFDVEAYPRAQVEVTEMRVVGPDQYEGTASVKVKDHVATLRLPFSVKLEGGAATAEGTLSIDRTALGLGLTSDPLGDWVSKTVNVEFELTAHPAVE